ncbi:hypothetical protein [Thermohalobacter berrensis]|uniref:HTH cro/C1-type domain-containing protein n=1 Tax=Thermohalobacter berrensis TaxID=99594 RepID=A0A419TB08_9FIRM|nr:hypothetical protein [Thermohalobacter berrensis]RKD34645.1 hypothetical protein BET03_02120 [Thermohalobacter berrensis]
MRKSIYEYIYERNQNMLRDIDLHDFIELSNKGLSNDELARELGIPKTYINKVLDDIGKGK